jgi:hypothetical protein
MKKLLVPLAALLLLALAVPAAFGEVELGISATPVPIQNGDVQETSTITGFHVGYAWGVLYASWDALAMPAQVISNMTGYFDPLVGQYILGPMVPGFLNLYDVGIRLMLRPIVIYTTVGTNSIYVYKPSEHPGFGGDFGANFRVGAGAAFGFWGVNVSGTAVFANFSQLAEAFKNLAAESTRQAGIDALVNSLVPSVNLTFYF